jgi:hypothetical protein
MADDILPEIQERVFPPLSAELLESVLKRTLEYDCTDHVLAIEAWEVVKGNMVDYKQVMRDIARLLLGDSWYFLSKEPSNNGVPVLVFQKERVNVLLAGSNAAGLGMVVVLVTSESKQDMAFAGKAIQKIIEKQCKLAP